MLRIIPWLWNRFGGSPLATSSRTSRTALPASSSSFAASACGPCVARSKPCNAGKLELLLDSFWTPYCYRLPWKEKKTLFAEMQALKKKLQRQEKVVHVPKVMQHERQGCSQKYRVTARQLGHTSWRQPVSKEVVHLPVKQHVEQVVQAPVVLDPVLNARCFPANLKLVFTFEIAHYLLLTLLLKYLGRRPAVLRAICNCRLQNLRTRGISSIEHHTMYEPPMVIIATTVHLSRFFLRLVNGP